MYRRLLVAVALLFGSASAALPAAANPYFAPTTLRVEYRLTHWKERVFTNCHEAQRFAEAKRAQGFQVTIEPHGQCHRVQFRSLGWHLYSTMSCPTEAQQIEGQLRRQGYDTRVVTVP